MDKRSKEQEQIDHLFNNLFKPKKTKLKEKDNIENNNKNRAKTSDKETIPKDGLDKEVIDKNHLDKDSLRKKTIGKINLRKRGHYTMVDNHILDYAIKKLKPAQFIVYIYLYRKTYGWKNDSNEITISSSIMQAETDMSHVTIGKHISALEDEGLIEIVKEKNRNRSRTYKIILPSQVEGFLPKELLDKTSLPNNSLDKNSLPKENNNFTEKNFRSTTKNNLGKNSLGEASKSSHGKVSQNNKNVPKDIIKDIYKDNNKTAELLLSSNIIKFPEPLVYKLSQTVNYEILKKWLKFIEDEQNQVENPSGFLRTALEQDWAIPTDWEKNFERRKNMEEKARQQEKKLAKEKAEWENWLSSISDDLLKEAEEYADNEMEAAIRKPSNEEAKQAMWNGFMKKYLREKFDEQKAAYVK